MKNTISVHELLVILVIFLGGMFALVNWVYKDKEPLPVNCEGIAANNKHIQVTACSCDKDGSECHVTIKR